MNSHHSSLERLEARIAPAGFLIVRTSSTIYGHASAAVAASSLFTFSPDSKSATYTDGDGDLISLTVSKGRLRIENFDFTPIAGTSRVDVHLLDLTALGLGAKFQGASIDFRVVNPAGDSFGDLRGIKANGIDLGRVIIRDGDLGQIDAGDANLATPAIALIQANQMGFYGIAGQPAGQDTISRIRGSVGAIDVLLYRDAFIDVRGGGIGAITLNDISDLDSQINNGSIRATGAIGTVLIRGNIEGAAGDYSGVIWSRTRIGSITVFGDIKGGGGFDSGAIFAGSPDSATAPFAGTIGPVIVYGSILGGAGEHSGTLSAESGVRNVTIAGDITGGPGAGSGSLVSGLGFANISIRGNLTSGTAAESGSIIALAGDAPNIVIGGKIIAGNSAGSGILIDGAIGTLNFQSAPDANGNSTEIRALRGIGAINVFGDMFDVFVSAGSTGAGVPRNANASIGSVLIGGNFIGGGLIAGGAAGLDAILFTADDILYRPDPAPAILSRIGTVLVGGTLDAFAIEAEQLGIIIVGTSPVPLQPGARNDNFLQGTTVIKEIA